MPLIYREPLELFYLEDKSYEEISDILECPNPNCITNADEPVKTKFFVILKKPVSLRCYYCERIMEESEIEAQL
jgi:aspartate carbamoyltransferase regulatory subunit